MSVLIGVESMHALMFQNSKQPKEQTNKKNLPDDQWMKWIWLVISTLLLLSPLMPVKAVTVYLVNHVASEFWLSCCSINNTANMFLCYCSSGVVTHIILRPGKDNVFFFRNHVSLVHKNLESRVFFSWVPVHSLLFYRFTAILFSRVNVSL